MWFKSEYFFYYEILTDQPKQLVHHDQLSGSQNLLRLYKSSYRTMLQLTQWSLSLWLSVRRSWTESEGFRNKQIWTPSSLDISPLDFSISSTIERDVSTRYNPNLDSLKAVIQSAWPTWAKKWCDFLTL